MATYYKGINVPATIAANAGGVTTHTWKIDGVAQAETTSSITRTYSTVGTHIIRHEGTNACGACATPVENTLIITETPPPGSSNTIYYAMGAAVLGFLILSKKK